MNNSCARCCLSLKLTAFSMWPPLYSYSNRQSIILIISYLSLYLFSKTSIIVSWDMRGRPSGSSAETKCGRIGTCSTWSTSMTDVRGLGDSNVSCSSFIKSSGCWNMLSDRRISFRCGRTKDWRPAEGFRTWQADGEPVVRLAAPREGLRGGGSMEAAAPSTGDSVNDSSKLGVDEQERL